MSYIHYNANPANNYVDDCTIRAISTLTGRPWREVYLGVVEKGYEQYVMPSTNKAWMSYMRELGFVRHALPDTCPDCYSVREFCRDHPFGKYLVATHGHVLAVINGDYYDTGDSGDEIPVSFWSFERR